MLLKIVKSVELLIFCVKILAEEAFPLNHKE